MSITTVYGSVPAEPEGLITTARELAKVFGRDAASDDILLLALTTWESPARDALANNGVTAETLRSVLHTGSSATTEALPYFSPGAMRARGWASGFAAAKGRPASSAEDLLLALLWDPMSNSSQVLWHSGIGREGIVSALADAGVEVPTSPIPAQQSVPMGPEEVPVPLNQLRRAQQVLESRLEPGKWRVRYSADMAYIVADSQVDLRSILADFLDSDEV